MSAAPFEQSAKRATQLLGFNPFEPANLHCTITRVGAMEPNVALGLLLFLTTHTQRNIHLTLQELRRMATNDAQLTQAVTDLTTAVTNNLAAVQAEITAIQGATTSETDPVITTAVANIEAIVSELNTATIAAQAAVAPVASTTASTTDAAATSTQATS